MIYFDNASTTPISDTVLQSMCTFYEQGFGNPSSPHGLGIFAERELRSDNRVISDVLGCHPDEILFTSGGTESNNLAIFGALRPFKHRGGQIISTPAEHPSILEPLRILSSEGFHVILAPLQQWSEHINEKTVLCSCAQVNNETGDIHDVAAVAASVSNINPNVIIHVDGAQGFGKLPVSLDSVDLYSWSGHKIHAPKGIGGLMIRKGTTITPFLYGGGQQRGLRPGTENTSGIHAMAVAARTLCQHQAAYVANATHVKAIISELVDLLPNTQINHYTDHQSPFILNMSFLGIKGETLVHMLSAEDICISMGAACRTRKMEKSPLTAMGFDKERVESAVRFSFSGYNTVEEAETVKDTVVRLVKRIRALNPAKNPAKNR